MNRRDIIKGLGLTFGYAVAAPSVLSLLESCSTKKEDSWEAVFLNGSEKHYISLLVDIILPATDTPGGLEVNLPQFIDMMSHDMLEPDEQEIFKEGSLVFSQRFKDKFNKDIGDSNRDELTELIANYFDLEPDVQSKVLIKQSMGLDQILETRSATSLAEILVSFANERTSSATTLNPLPASPALAASIAAFKASKLV